MKKNNHEIGSAPDIARHLEEAITQLQRDLNRVEVWAGALSGFVRPVPQYLPSSEFLLAPAASDDPEPRRGEHRGKHRGEHRSRAGKAAPK